MVGCTRSYSQDLVHASPLGVWELFVEGVAASFAGLWRWLFAVTVTLVSQRQQDGVQQQGPGAEVVVLLYEELPSGWLAVVWNPPACGHDRPSP